MRLFPLVPFLAAALLLSGCDRDAAPAGAGDIAADPAPADADAAAAAQREDFQRTWVGVLPCADCAGIQTRLQLLRVGDVHTYQLEETYLGADGEAVFTQSGRWVQEDAADAGRQFRLDPGAATGRRYGLRPDGALEQLDGDGEPIDDAGQYRLQRL